MEDPVQQHQKQIFERLFTDDYDATITAPQSNAMFRTIFVLVLCLIIVSFSRSKHVSTASRFVGLGVLLTFVFLVSTAFSDLISAAAITQRKRHAGESVVNVAVETLNESEIQVVIKKSNSCGEFLCEGSRQSCFLPIAASLVGSTKRVLFPAATGPTSDALAWMRMNLLRLYPSFSIGSIEPGLSPHTGVGYPSKFLVVMNYRDTLTDIGLAATLIPSTHRVSVLCTQWWLARPFSSILHNLFGCISVKKDSPHSRSRALETMKHEIEKHEKIAMLVFPEGRWIHDVTKCAPFHRGAFVTATDLQIPVMALARTDLRQNGIPTVSFCGFFHPKDYKNSWELLSDAVRESMDARIQREQLQKIVKLFTD